MSVNIDDPSSIGLEAVPTPGWNNVLISGPTSQIIKAANNELSDDERDASTSRFQCGFKAENVRRYKFIYVNSKLLQTINIAKLRGKVNESSVLRAKELHGRQWEES